MMPAAIPELQDKAWLEAQYLTKGDRAIAADLGCHICTVFNARKRLNIVAPLGYHQVIYGEHLGTDEVLRRLFAQTNIVGACWLWTGAHMPAGYGKVSRAGKHLSTHRFVWELLHGPIPEKMCICHHCDTPPCIRPEHLFLGTSADNNADIARKGRTSRGEKHVHAKMTSGDVRLMRYLHGQGMTQMQLAKHFAIDHVTVGCIVRRATWRYVADELSYTEAEQARKIVQQYAPRPRGTVRVRLPRKHYRKPPRQVPYHRRNPNMVFSRQESSEQLREKFLSCLDTTGECWLWMGSRDICDYGRLRCDKRTVKAHRFSYELHYGLIPEGQSICHMCDTPACCRPEHLWLGDPVNNMLDMVKKGRSLQGIRNPHAIFTDDIVQQIRVLYATGKYTQTRLAAMFATDQGQISRIVLLKSWRHVV